MADNHHLRYHRLRRTQHRYSGMVKIRRRGTQGMVMKFCNILVAAVVAAAAAEYDDL